MGRDDWRAARAEGQRRRIIALLEDLTETEPKAQCRKCGCWYDNLSAHRPHCDGP